jgi:putative flippase GtrA
MDTSFVWIIIKFGIVGAIGVAVDFVLTYILKEKAHFHKYLSNSLGFVAAASNNYILNRLWTFHSDNPNILREYSDFIIISVVGLLINNWVIWIAHDKKKLNFYLAKVIAVLVVMFWNFTGNYFYTFKDVVNQVTEHCEVFSVIHF